MELPEYQLRSQVNPNSHEVSLCFGFEIPTKGVPKLIPIATVFPSE